MLQHLSLAVVLLGSVTAYSGEQPPAAAGIVAGLATACSEGVRRAVEQEIWSANNQSVRTSSGHQQTAQQIMSSLQQVLQDTRLAPEGCLPGWSRHEDSCYLIPPQKTTWFRAHHACAVLHPRSHLASVHPASGQFVETMVAESKVEKAVWVGLTGGGRAGDWVWSDGTPFDYAHWDRNQPDGGNPSCIHLGWPSFANNLWHDNGCNTVVNFLCQINLS